MEKSFGHLDTNWTSKSITCTKIPEEFLDKAVAKKHFSTFGTIKSFSLRPKNYSCSVEFENIEEAEFAKQNGNVYNDYAFEIEFTEEHKGSSLLDIDPDVQMELHAMKGGSIFSESLVQGQATYIKKLPKPIKTESLNAELEQLLRRQAYSVEDKYRILDARDKFIRQYQQVEKGKCLIGSCPDMCPEKERVMREFQMQVSSFEMSPGTNQMDHRLAVKQYSRSSADQETPLSHELRPEAVLRMSMNYLLTRIVDLSEDPKTNISDWFHFVWDRMRSIRKDITQQDLCTLETVTLVEQCARFHIHCSARLVAEDPSVFDQKINTENLTKCLQTLKYMYRDLRLQNIVCPNEPEFRAYVVLLNLNDGNFLWEFQQFPDNILKSNELKFAFLIYQAVENNNYVRFFQLVSQTTYLNACILLRYFTQVRLKALHILLKAYSPKNPSKFSLKEFSRVLAFEDFESTSSFLDCHGLACDFEAVYLDKRNFFFPDFPYTQERSLGLVESKRNLTVGEKINGKPYTSSQMPDQSNHQLQNSFDENGYLANTFGNILFATKRQEPESVFKVPQTRTVSPRPKRILEGSSKLELTVVGPTAIPVINNDTKIEIHPLLSQLTPPQSGSSEPTSINSGFNFLQAFETKNSELTQPEHLMDKKPQTIISFPPNVFKSPTNKMIVHIQKTPESMDSPDSLKKNTPSPSCSSTSSISPIDDKIKANDTGFKLKYIQDSSISLSSELVNEVTSEMILSCANDEFTRNKHLYDIVPKQLLSNLIDEILTDTLTEIGETELLVEQILEARKLKNLYKVIKHWIFITRRNVYRKQQLISAPIYIDNSPLSVVAEEFRHPNQRKSIDLIKDQLNHTNLEHQLALSRPDNKIDLLKIVANEFKFKASNLNYWKAIVSIPDDKEECFGKFPILIESWLKSAFPSTETSGTLTMKQYVKKLKRDLALCLQTIKGIYPGTKDKSNKIKSASGLIFIINYQSARLSINRWNNLISQLSSRCVPVAIIICNNNHLSTDEIASHLNLNDKTLNKFTIFLHSSKEMNLKACVEQGLRYIASDSNLPVTPLEMELTETCLSKTLSQELWCRVLTTIDENEALCATCRKDCTFLVNVFNKALDQLIILLGKSFDDVVMFPMELEQYVGHTNKKFPISIEHFPNNWIDARNISKLTDFLKSLCLPHFGRHPSKDLSTLKEQIASYVRTVLGDVQNISRLINLAQMYVSYQSDTEIEVSWIQIIRLIAVQHLQENMSRTNITVTTPFVVYDYFEMFNFMNEPWWLKMDFDKVTEKYPSIITTNEIQISKKRKSTGDVSLAPDEVSKILKTGEATLKKLELRSIERNDNHLPRKDNVVSVFQDAESYFEKNKILWKSYEEKLFGSP